MAGIEKTTAPYNRGAGHFVSGPIDPNINNEHITIAANAGDLKAGTVLGRAYADAPDVTATAFASNTGTGTMAATPTADAGAKPGVWKVVVTEPASGAGAFEVRDPDGILDGVGDVASAYNGSINFTLQDGDPDFATGDGFDIELDYSETSFEYVQHNPDATDGSQRAAAILWDDRDDSTSTQRAAGVLRGPVAVNGNALTWHTGITTAERTAAMAQLEALNIQVRY